MVTKSQRVQSWDSEIHTHGLYSSSSYESLMPFFLSISNLNSQHFVLSEAWLCWLQGSSIFQLQFAQVTQEAGRKHPSITQPSSWRPCLVEHGTLVGRAWDNYSKYACCWCCHCLWRHIPNPQQCSHLVECWMSIREAHPFHISEKSDTEGQVPLKMSRLQRNWQVNFCIKIHFQLWSKEIMLDSDGSQTWGLPSAREERG